MISKTKLFALVLFALSIPSSHAFNDTSDFWRCENRVGGAWVFGTVPYACDVQPFGEPTYVQQQFAPVICDDLAGQPVETSRYMESLNSVIRDASDYYLSIRKPTERIQYATTRPTTTSGRELKMSKNTCQFG